MKLLHEKSSVNRHRRGLVLGVAGGVTAATVWKKPIINSVVLPAHAQTSMMVTSFGGTGLSDSGITRRASQHKGILANLVEKAIPAANAQAMGTFYACASVDGGTATVSVAGLNNDSVAEGFALVIRRGTLPLPAPMGSGGAGEIVAAGADVSPCAGRRATEPRQARITSISETELVVEILTDCGEAVGPQCDEGEFLQLAIPATNGACPAEPPIYQGPCLNDR